MFRAHIFAWIFCGLLPWAGVARGQVGLVDVFRPLPPFVFFPPTPPVYGAKIENAPAGQSRRVGGQRLLAPDGLADFVSDSFFPALSTRLHGAELSRGLETRIRTYQARRLQQASSLLDQFLNQPDVSADTRERELRTFAAIQSPQLAALEIEAEQLREALVADGLRNGIDWNAHRRWKLAPGNERNDWAEIEGEFQVVRATAFYQPGLTPQQRGLPSARDESDAMFFSPETTRFHLPLDL